MKFASALILSAASVAQAVHPSALAADMDRLMHDASSMEQSSFLATSASTTSVDDAQQSAMCRSASHEGVCRSDCGEHNVVESPDRQPCAEGELCCEMPLHDVMIHASMESDATGAEEPEGVANADPDAGEGDEGAARHSAFLSPVAKCYGTQQPFDCGRAYRRGRSLGNKMCVKMRGNTIVESLACKLEEMLKAAEAAGHTVQLNSGFRTNAKQAQLRRQNCRSGKCRPATAPAGYSNHQSGIAYDIACRSNPRLYQWLKENAHKYSFVRTVSSEEWHWEYRPGTKCNHFVTRERNGSRYNCVNGDQYERLNAGPLEKCKDHDNLVCVWGRSSCGSGGYHSGQCAGDSWCCKDYEYNHGNGSAEEEEEESEAPATEVEPAQEDNSGLARCDRHTDLVCKQGRSSCSLGYFSGECRGDTWCCKEEQHLAKCDNHSNLVCKPGRSSCGSAGYHRGECRGDTWCCKE